MTPEISQEDAPKARKAKRLLWFAIGVLLAVNAAILLKVCLPGPKVSRDISEPARALRFVGEKNLFDPRNSAERMRAAQSARLFRDMDRVYKYDAVLLPGDPKTYRDLIKHFRTNPEWVLAYLDHTSLVYLRAPAKAWDPGDLGALRADFEKRSTEDREAFHIQLAARLMAVGQLKPAREEIDAAMNLDSRSPEVWTQLSAWHGASGEWKQALEAVNKALALRSDYAPALSMQAQAYFAMGRFSEAFLASNQLVRSGVNDPQTLFLHARIAHEAHAYTHEIEALTELIRQAQAAGQSASGYQIYLGQAYAKRGESTDAEACIDAFEKAAAAGDLTPEQDQFVRETLQTIRSRVEIGK